MYNFIYYIYIYRTCVYACERVLVMCVNRLDSV